MVAEINQQSKHIIKDLKIQELQDSKTDNTRKTIINTQTVAGQWTPIPLTIRFMTVFLV